MSVADHLPEYGCRDRAAIVTLQLNTVDQLICPNVSSSRRTLWPTARLSFRITVRGGRKLLLNLAASVLARRGAGRLCMLRDSCAVAHDDWLAVAHMGPAQALGQVKVHDGVLKLSALLIIIIGGQITGGCGDDVHLLGLVKAAETSWASRPSSMMTNHSVGGR